MADENIYNFSNVFHFFMHYVHDWLAYYFGTHYSIPTEVHYHKMANFPHKCGSIYLGEYDAQELIYISARV